MHGMVGYKPELSVLIVTHSKHDLAIQLALSIMLSRDTPNSVEFLVYRSGNPNGLSPGEFERKLRATFEVCAAPFSKLARLVVVEDCCNLGICVGFNALIALAQGKYLYLCNDDQIVNGNGWYVPLRDAVEHQGLGVACSQLVNGGKEYTPTPNPVGMLAHILDFSSSYLSAPSSSEPIQHTESNQPWFVKKENIELYAAMDPIVNQKKWICEWIDPHGIGWHTDWGCYHQIRLAGHRLGVVPQSMVYHYGHVTVASKDRAEPGWTEISKERYAKKWGTYDKQLPAPSEQRKFRLVNDELVQVQ